MMKEPLKKTKSETVQISNPLEGLLGYHLRRASSAMVSRLSESYNQLGLRLTEASVLIMIDSNSGSKQSDIGRALDIKSANMTPLVAVLSKLDYIERKKLDGRSQGLYTTDKGKQVVKKIWQLIEANEAWLLSSMQEDAQGSLRERFKTTWQ